MTAVFCAAIISSAARHAPADVADHEVSPAAARALHADAVRLKRGELLFVIPSATLAIAAVVMTSMLPVLLTTLLLAGQAPAIAPIRLGLTGDRLTNDDLDQIGRLGQGVGGAVWVLVGHPPRFEPGPWYVEVYLDPDRTSPDVRRGRIQLVTASLPSRGAYAAAKRWELVSGAEYAQVVVQGTKPHAVTGSRDLNRPFRIVGTLDDEALVAIVSLIRSSPKLPPPPDTRTSQPMAGIFTQVEGSWPIVAVTRQGDAVEVSLIDATPSEKSGQKVMLRGSGKSWTAEWLTVWIAD